MRRRGDIGETLVEILLTTVIIGLTVTALVSSLATVGNAGTAQRLSVRADVVMRDYAEATKEGVRDCQVGAAYAVDYAAPADFDVATVPGDNICPDVSTPEVLRLTVTGPGGVQKTMEIRVGTP